MSHRQRRRQVRPGSVDTSGGSDASGAVSDGMSGSPLTDQQQQQQHTKVNQSFAFSVARMCENLHESDPGNVLKIDNKRSMGYLALATHSWIKQVVGPDLRAFAKFREVAVSTSRGKSTRRKKLTVKPEDVMLITRRNQMLNKRLRDFYESLLEEKEKRKDQGRVQSRGSSTRATGAPKIIRPADRCKRARVRSDIELEADTQILDEDHDIEDDPFDDWLRPAPLDFSDNSNTEQHDD